MSVCATGMSAKKTAAIGAPIRRYGMRLPIFVLVLSLAAPMIGWMVTARMLSKVMMSPMRALEAMKPLRMIGTKLL